MSVFSESVGDGVAEFTHFPLGASVVLPTVHDAPSESFYLEVFGATSFTPVVVSVATVAVWMRNWRPSAEPDSSLHCVCRHQGLAAASRNLARQGDQMTSQVS